MAMGGKITVVMTPQSHRLRMMLSITLFYGTTAWVVRTAVVHNRVAGSTASDMQGIW
jgi:hypothetical protein